MTFGRVFSLFLKEGKYLGLKYNHFSHVRRNLCKPLLELNMMTSVVEDMNLCRALLLLLNVYLENCVDFISGLPR